MAISKLSLQIDPDLRELEKALKGLDTSTLSKKEQAQLKKTYNLKLAQEKRVSSLTLTYIKQGYKEEQANLFAIQEARLTGIDAEIAKRRRQQDALRIAQEKKEIASQKRIADKRKQFFATAGAVALGTATGSALAGAGKKIGSSLGASGEIDSFSAAYKRIENEEALITRTSEDTLKSISAIRMRTGDTFEEVANTFISVQNQLRDIIPESQQKQIISKLSRFSDAFVGVSEITGEFLSAVAGSEIARGSELERIIGSDAKRRQYNRFLQNQAILVEAGGAEDLQVRSLERERERFLSRQIDTTKTQAYSPTALTQISRGAKIANEEITLKNVKKPINFLDLNNPASINTGISALVAIQQTANLAGAGTGFQMAISGANTLGEAGKAITGIYNTSINAVKDWGSSTVSSLKGLFGGGTR